MRTSGLSRNSMAELTTLTFRPLEAHRNLISIKAGDKDGPKSLVFRGEITTAFADFNAAPDVYMQIEASTGVYPQQFSSAVATIHGEVAADLLFSQYAAQAGYAFINGGVKGSVQHILLPGSPIAKMEKLARDMACELIIDDDTITVMPAGKARFGDAVFLSKNNGLIGYPTFNQDGISCRCLYNPALRYGGLIKVDSVVPRATGIWRITRLAHKLAAYMPSGGPWESQIEAAYYE